jgi:hypothetical protein
VDCLSRKCITVTLWAVGPFRNFGIVVSFSLCVLFDSIAGRDDRILGVWRHPGGPSAYGVTPASSCLLKKSTSVSVIVLFFAFRAALQLSRVAQGTKEKRPHLISRGGVHSHHRRLQQKLAGWGLVLGLLGCLALGAWPWVLGPGCLALGAWNRRRLLRYRIIPARAILVSVAHDPSPCIFVSVRCPTKPVPGALQLSELKRACTDSSGCSGRERHRAPAGGSAGQFCDVAVGGRLRSFARSGSRSERSQLERHPRIESQCRSARLCQDGCVEIEFR